MDDYEYGIPDPDYGPDYSGGGNGRSVSRPSIREAKRIAEIRAEQESVREVSNNFNRHMIDLYNARVK